jgi:hypothetical protein
LRRQPTLRSQLNQIRLWVRQGRTDAWIAHKLDVSIEQLERFKRDHDLEEGGSAPARPADPLSVPPPEPEPEPEPAFEPEAEDEEDLAGGPPPLDFTAVEPIEVEDVDEDEPEVEEEPEPAEERAGASGDGRRKRGDSGRPARTGRTQVEAGAPEAARRSRRRGRRGGRRRKPRPSSYEATFDHGEEGYGLWLDPAIADNPVYAEHWAGRRAVRVTLDRDSITIRRADEPDAEDSREAG